MIMIVLASVTSQLLLTFNYNSTLLVRYSMLYYYYHTHTWFELNHLFLFLCTVSYWSDHNWMCSGRFLIVYYLYSLIWFVNERNETIYLIFIIFMWSLFVCCWTKYKYYFGWTKYIYLLDLLLIWCFGCSMMNQIRWFGRWTRQFKDCIYEVAIVGRQLW